MRVRQSEAIGKQGLVNMKRSSLARWMGLVFVAAFSCSSYAARPGLEGKKLAQESVALLKKSEPMAIEGNGLKAASAAVYYRAFENSLQDHLAKWPTNVDPEFRTWGDYFYCRDAVLSLKLIGMAQNQGNRAQFTDQKVADYRRTRDKCYESARKSPDDVQ